jgi:peptide/nickel transport system permease protein
MVFVLIFYVALGWAPAPVGRLDIQDIQPPRTTGLYLVDTILSGDLAGFGSAIAHLILPASTLALVYAGSFYRQAHAALEQELSTTRVLFARACGLRSSTIILRSLRNALPPVLAVVGTTYAYMLGGAVLVETVFSWGGVGQYAVTAVASSDYAAIAGVVLVTALFTLVTYSLVDIANAVLDPRIRHAQ